MNYTQMSRVGHLALSLSIFVALSICYDAAAADSWQVRANFLAIDPRAGGSDEQVIEDAEIFTFIDHDNRFGFSPERRLSGRLGLELGLFQASPDLAVSVVDHGSGEALGDVDSLDLLGSAESGFYLGMGGGGASYDLENDGLSAVRPTAFDSGGRLSVEETSSLGRLLLGYRIHRNFAIEGAWQRAGEVSVSQATADLTTGERATLTNSIDETEGFAVWARGILPLGDGEVARRFELFAKLGVLFWETESSTSLVLDNVFDGAGGPFGAGSAVGLGATEILADRTSESGNSLGFGLGLSFSITRRAAVRLEWDRFMDVGTVSISDIPSPGDSPFLDPSAIGFEEDLDMLVATFVFRF